MMWFSFWRSRNRFSLEELRYLTDQLGKVQIVNDVNKDFVIEALRSIAELVTYGDQHDSSFFEFFMEKQVLREFVRILEISKTITISLQLLQTMSIIIQNLKNEHAIYSLFSNEHINYLISYSFDFRNEELLSYYISFLRAISGNLNKSTISLLVETQNGDVVSFPLYVEAIRFAFHEESMIRIAVRALILNVYHVGDDSVNRYVTSGPLANYFLDLVTFFKKQCLYLNDLVVQASVEPSQELSSNVISTVDEIEDNLYYFSDVISAGIPDVDRLMTDNQLQYLVLPLLLPSLTAASDTSIGAITSMYLLCSILRIVKIKDLANTIAAALFCPQQDFLPLHDAKAKGNTPSSKTQHPLSEENRNGYMTEATRNLRVSIPEDAISLDGSGRCCLLSLREAMLSYLSSGSDVQVLGALLVLATLLQTKELDELMLDALGILPQRKQHKKLLLQALVGESAGEEQLFSSGSILSRSGSTSELDFYLQKLKEYGIFHSLLEIRSSPRSCRFQVLDALVNLFCRTDISAGTLWDGGWLLRQLLPYSEEEFNREHIKLLRESYNKCSSHILVEATGMWADFLVSVLCNEWRKCKRSSSPCHELKSILLPSHSGDVISSESSSAGERMLELVKAFVLLYQLQMFSQGKALPDHAPIYPPVDFPGNSRARALGLDIVGPRLGNELELADALPCRIAFERGRERHVWFQAVSMGTSGWLLLLEELPLRKGVGVVRVVAPLASCNPRIDDKHPRWLHLRIRPHTLPCLDPSKSAASGKTKPRALVDGRWTLAFRDDEMCQSAVSMIREELDLQTQEVERRVQPLFLPENSIDLSNFPSHIPETPTNKRPNLW